MNAAKENSNHVHSFDLFEDHYLTGSWNKGQLFRESGISKGALFYLFIYLFIYDFKKYAIVDIKTFE